MLIPPHAFALPITVQPNHIDGLNHVNNVVYIQWLQEVATAHWQKSTTSAMRQLYAWVVKRHEIDYLRPSFLGDSLTAYTWVLPPKGSAFDRLVVITNNAHQKPILYAKTTWHLLDAQTLRSKVVPPEISTIFGLSDPKLA